MSSHKVPQSIVDSLLEALPKTEPEKDSYINAAFSELKRKNSTIFRFIKYAYNHYTDDPHSRRTIALCGIVMYRALHLHLGPRMPRVSNDTSQGFLVEVNRALESPHRPVDLLIENLLAEIHDNNIALFNLLKFFSQKPLRNRERRATIIAGSFIYKLIIAKLEADQLEKKYFP